jgi:peptidoglycan/LPS O-acetylase OafA/YrhL
MSPHGCGEREQEAAENWLFRGRVPGLDGLRAVAIVLVLLAHGVKTHGFPFADQLHGLLAEGGLGVDLFFLISGFLITLLLLREQKKSGKISIPAFYSRRCLRILPAYVTVVVVLSGLVLFRVVSIGTSDWLAALTYTTNWLPDPGWVTGHFWSLSLEEHFYLLWPLLCWLGPRWAWGFGGVCIVGMPVARLVLWTSGFSAIPVETSTLTRLDGIATGCVLALLIWQPRGRALGAWTTRHAAWLAPLALAILVGSVILSVHWYRFHLLLGYSLNHLALAVLIWVCMTSGGRLGQVLQSRPLVVLGTLSYSIYLWQQLFLNPDSSSWVCRWPVNVGLVLVTAAASYGVIERPFLRLKEGAGKTVSPWPPRAVGRLVLEKNA